MPSVLGYNAFGGRHHETGTLANALEAAGVIAPHTGKPYSEALLLGLSGGLLVGYFSFAYQGMDPHVALLGRNTFDPFATMLERLGAVQHLRHATNEKGATKHLLDALEGRRPTIVWADAFSLPYNGFQPSESWWAMQPLVVFGLEDGVAQIADRSLRPLAVAEDVLIAARGRVKKDRYRLLTLDAPNPASVIEGARAGIADTLRRYTEPPVPSSAKSFGFAAFDHWIALLESTGERQRWAKVFPPGIPLFAGLTSAYSRWSIGAKAGAHERRLFAEFLREAALLLANTSLEQAAAGYGRCAEAWDRVCDALLPADVPALANARAATDARAAAFRARGADAAPELRAADAALAALREQAAEELGSAAWTAMRPALVEAIASARDSERAAAASLEAALG